MNIINTVISSGIIALLMIYKFTKGLVRVDNTCVDNRSFSCISKAKTFFNKGENPILQYQEDNLNPEGEKNVVYLKT